MIAIIAVYDNTNGHIYVQKLGKFDHVDNEKAQEAVREFLVDNYWAREFAQKAKMHSYDYDELIEDAACDGIIISGIQYL